MTASLLRRAALAGAAAALVAAGTAGAVIGLPSDGSQVNNDPADGIDPSQNAGVSDIVGGSLAAGGARVPWATFEQQTGGAQQIFVRAFKGGQWVTQGPSLNIDQNVEAEAPSIDFAGAGRTVPWDAWYEPNTAARRREADLRQPLRRSREPWQPEGQDRGSGVPSLNIHTDKEAENPSVAGGAAVAGNDPVPWVAWEEQDGNVNGPATTTRSSSPRASSRPLPGPAPASSRPRRPAWALLLAAGRPRPAAKDGALRHRRPDAEHRPEPQRRRARHRVHGRQRHRRLGRLVREGPEQLGLRNNEQVFAAQIVADPERRRRLQLARRRQRHRGQNNVLDTTAQRLRHLRRLDRRRGRLLAEQGRHATTPRTRASRPARSPRARRPCRGSSGRRTSAAATRSSSRAWSAATTSSCSTAATPSRPRTGRRQPGHHVLRQHAVRLLDGKHGDDTRGFVGHFDASGAFVLDTPGGIRLTTRRGGGRRR